MYNIEKLSDMIKQNKFNECFEKLYGAEQIPYQKNRYLNTLNAFKKHFPECENVGIFSVPGRTEIGGNHTDHQHGAVLAGAIDKDIIAVASINGDNVIRIRSDALADNNVCISDLNTQKAKKQTSDALIEGVSARLFELGANVGGFNAVTSSDIPIGSGLSSSAAFEVLIGLMINSLYNFSSLSELTLAKAARYAENVYFGKSCVLMDQLVCALGGICAIDFKDSENPEYKKINYDFEKSGYSPVIVNTFSCHKGLSEEYSLIPYEMGKVA